MRPALLHHFKQFFSMALFAFIYIGQTAAQVPEILYYKFDQSGTTVTNLASSPPMGTETATIEGSLTQGGMGQCDGALIGSGNSSNTDYVNTGWAPNLTGSSWTLSFWINNVSNYSALWYIFGDANSGSFRCFTNGVAGADNFMLRGGLTDVPVPGGAAAGPQVITFVYDLNLNNIKAYLNGVLVNTIAQGAVTISGPGPLKVGGYFSNAGLAPGSRMDEFRLYNRALNETEVAGLVGEGVCLCYVDADGDGYGDPNSAPEPQVAGSCPMGYVSNSDDCDDSDSAINPGATEICNNMIDDNCDGITDTGDDIDGDGYTIAQNDCDDCNAAINPGATEVCNGIDDDCDGETDESTIPVVDCGLLYGFSPFQDSVWTLDTFNNYQIVQRRSTNLPGFTITGVNALAQHPITGVYYIVAKVSGVSGRVLCTWDATTSTATQIGNLGTNFSSLTFSPSGQLFGATGNGAMPPETLFEIDPATAATTLLVSLGNGADGEIICYNPDDDMIYHWSGNGTVIFEKIEPVPPYTITNIPIIGATSGETFGAAYIGNGKFLISNISSSFNIIRTDGTWGPAFGSNPDDLRGLAFGVCEVTCYLDSDNDGFGDATSPQVFQGTCGQGYVLDNTDCNDMDSEMHPCNLEICDNKDNDCNSMVDDGISCDEDGDGYTEAEGDCDDTNPDLSPGTAPAQSNVVYHNQNSVTIYWSTVPGSTNYGIRYRLQGSSDPWIEATSLRAWRRLYSLAACTSYEVQFRNFKNGQWNCWSVNYYFTTPCAKTFGTGKNGDDLSAGMQVFPNPTSDILNIVLDENMLDKAVRLTLRDQLGRDVWSRNIQNLETTLVQLNVREHQLATGVYTLSLLQNEKGITTTQVLINQ